MEKLKEAVIKLASAKQKEHLSPSQIALIDKRLHESFPHGLRLPSHPPYASMIARAITELNEEGGSSEESISEYMKANYDGLPWAHKSILSHHLDRLCEVEGSIMLIANNRYSIPGFTPKTVVKKGRLKRKSVGMKEEVRCQENLDECRHPKGSSCGKEDGKMMSARALRRGRRRLALQEKGDNLGLDSCQGIEAERVENGCEDRVVVGDGEDQKGQESEMPGKGELEQQTILIMNKHSISEMVKIRHSKREGKCDQLLTLTTEKESLMDVCQDETRNEMIAMEDDNNGDGLMSNDASYVTPVMTKKKNTEREKICLGEREIQCDQLLTGGTDEKPLVEEGLDKTSNKILAVEDDSNGGDLMSNGASFETSVKEKKKDAGEVKFYHRRERKCNQLPTGGAEKKSLVDECQQETVKEALALEDDSNGVDAMNNGASSETPMKKDAEDRSLVDETRKETIALENDSNGVDVMNNDASSETFVKEKKDAGEVKICGSKREIKCDQPLNGDAEEKSLVDECQEETRKETIGLENDSNGVDVMNNDASFKTPVKVKKDVGKVKNRGRPRKRKFDQPPNGDVEEKSLVDGCQEEMLNVKKDVGKVRNRGRPRKIKRDQPLNGDAEEKSLVDECQEETRKETIGLENDSTGVDLMTNGASFETPDRKKKDTEKVNTRRSERARKPDQLLTEEAEAGNEVLYLEADSKGGDLMNNGVSCETQVKKKKRAEKSTKLPELVCGIATKLPELMQPERRVTRQISKSKEQPNKLIISTSKLPQYEHQQGASVRSSKKAKSDSLSWVQPLLNTTFSGECKVHPSVKESLNFHCLDCNKGALCTSCVTTSHEDHCVVRIKKVDFDDTVAVDKSSIKLFVDISGIHVHEANASDSFIILKKSPPRFRSTADYRTCKSCTCPVPYPSWFCSLSCKHKQQLADSSPRKIK